MKPYPSYKDSGVEWIGKIPTHWGVKRLKFLTTPKKEKSDDGSEELLSVSEYLGVVPRKILRQGEDYLTRSESLEGYLKVSKGNLVNNIMLMWKKGLGVSDYKGIVSPAYSVFDFNNSIPKYFHYLLRTDLYITEYRKNSTGIIDSRLRLYDDDFGNIFSFLPPLSEQNQIVSFLDHKTQKIDELIEKTEKKIELLKEKRTSLINHCVTKGLPAVERAKAGLNPSACSRTDERAGRNVEMKDSGVEWIGEIPSGWIRKKVKYLGTIKSGDGVVNTELDDDKEYPVYGGNGIMGYYDHFNWEETILVIGRVGEKCGNVHLVKEKCWVTDNSLILDLWFKDIYDWVYYSLDTRELNTLRNQNTQPLITSTLLKNESIPYPPETEQKEIVTFLDEQTQKIDSTIEKEIQRIELLKEYRQSLISEAVTGKIDLSADRQV